MDQIYLMMYNMMWTAIPPMVVGALDQVAPDHVLESQPSLYSQGRLGIVLFVYKNFNFVIYEIYWQSQIYIY